MNHKLIDFILLNGGAINALLALSIISFGLIRNTVLRRILQSLAVVTLLIALMFEIRFSLLCN